MICLLWQMTDSPSLREAPSAVKAFSWLWVEDAGAISLGSVNVTTAAARERMAVSHSPLMSPTSCIKRAAKAGPMMTAKESMACTMARDCCKFLPSLATTAGKSTSRAVIPGISPMAPRSPKSTNQPKFKPTVHSIIGNIATDSAEIQSAQIDTLRRLQRSRTAPPKSPAKNCGTAQIRARLPAAKGSPVFAKSTSGKMTARHCFRGPKKIR